MQNCKGHSLLEFMVVSALSMVLLGGLLVAYINMRQNFRLQHALVSMQGHLVSWAIIWQRAIRAAGDVSCQSFQYPVDQHEAIHAYAANNVPALLSGQVSGNNDVLVVRECVSYQGRQQVRKVAYFVGNTHQKTVNGQPILALFQKALTLNGGDHASPRQELIPGLSQLKLHFLTGKDSLNPKTVTQVSDWQKVCGVEAQALMISDDSVLKHAMHYVWQEKKHLAPDRRWYQSMQFYMALRDMRK